MRFALMLAASLIVCFSALGGLLGLLSYYPWAGMLAIATLIAGFVAVVTDVTPILPPDEL